jgi:NitT/TauT family transport system ATP-binding protein
MYDQILVLASNPGHIAAAQVSTNRIGGFVETLASPAHGGHAESADIARLLAPEINNLSPIADALDLLEFGELKDGALKLTHCGSRRRIERERKRLFRDHLIRFGPARRSHPPYPR